MADAVRDQYELYPYPPRDPADEGRRLILGSPSHIDEIDHYCFAGARDWRRPFRALIAGGGTGDACVMLAQQLEQRGTPAEVAHLDLSAAAQAIARARVAARGLRNVRFVQGSLLEVARLAPGPYDYIDCCGVLHHLADPPAGLRALAEALAPDGGMGLMLYGALGRSGVYPLQAVLRALGAGLDLPARVAQARTLLAQLPASNGFRRNPFVGDHRLEDGALVDLLLHPQDRAYTVPETAALLHGAGLAATAFIQPARYDPLHYLADTDLRTRAASLPWIERCALAEALAGSLKTHVFYAVPQARAAGAVARPAGPETVPVPREPGLERLSGRIKANFDGVEMHFDLPQGAPALLRLIDGRRTLGEMQRALGQDWFALAASFERAYAPLNALNLLLLRSRA